MPTKTRNAASKVMSCTSDSADENAFMHPVYLLNHYEPNLTCEAPTPSVFPKAKPSPALFPIITDFGASSLTEFKAATLHNALVKMAAAATHIVDGKCLTITPFEDIAAPLFTCNEKQRTRENQRKPYCPCCYYLLDWRFHLRPAPFPLKWRLYLPAPAMKNKEARKNNRKPKTKALLPMLLYATSPHIYYYLSYVY